MHIGLDFGTTNTSVAIIGCDQLRLVPLDPSAANPAVLRSVLFISRDGEQVFGQEAIERYIRGNVGRIIDYRQHFLGTHEMLFAGTEGTRGRDVHFVTDLYAVVDANPPGRLFQSLKTSLADEEYVTTDVFGTPWTVEQLVAAHLREIRQRVEQHTGEPVTSMTIGRPVHFGAAPEADALAMDRMRRACELAELPEVTFVLEPVAAAYAYAATLADPCHALVFDFGGGTLDITVITLDPGGSHVVLATDGVAIGGDRLDSKIVMGALLPHFGAGAMLGPSRRPLPAFLHEQLAGWQQIMDLHTPRTLQIIDEAINTADRRDQLRALRALVSTNSGVLLYNEVERAKCRLSSELETEISLDLDDIHFRQHVARTEFESLIGAEVRRIGNCLERAIEVSGLEPEEIDVVLRTGGSSRIPRFVRLLAERFGPGRLREQDPFTSVAAGLALTSTGTPHSFAPVNQDTASRAISSGTV